MKKPAVKEPSSKRAKPSPTAIPQTPDVPIPSPARNNIDMEDAGGQFDPMPEANQRLKLRLMMSSKVKRLLARFRVRWRMFRRGAVCFGNKSNLKSSVLSPARKMLATSYPAVLPLL
jgi:hypothetical protein